MIPLTMILRYGPQLAAAVAVMGAFAWVDHRAYRSGQAACEATHHAEAARQIETAQWAARSGAAAARAAIERERATADEIRSITDEAHGLDDPCLPAGIVQRLDALGR
jgi:hypothetical protein